MQKARSQDVITQLEGIAARLPKIEAQAAWVACIQEAIQAGREGNYSVGAVIAGVDGNVVARGRNCVFKPIFRSESHAEMNAITELESLPSSGDKSALVLYSTLEPCLMCTARILLSGITQVIFLHRDPTGGMCDQLHVLPPNYRDLGKRVRFTEYQGNTELKAFAKDLYDIGEEIWNREYQL